MTDAPRFSMQRADTAPIYAAPRRAETPVGEGCGRAGRTPQPVTGAQLPAPLPLTTDVPAPQVSEQARLIVVALALWMVLCGIAVVGLSARAYVTHTPPPPPTPCVVAAGRQCAVESATGAYTAYYIAWNQSVGIASPTPRPQGRNP